MDFNPHGLGREKLECQVGSPLKENDGSKDAFISYLITTHVSRSHALHILRRGRKPWLNTHERNS